MTTKIPATIEECRPEVQRFALVMEEKLRANDHKGGWTRECPHDLLQRVYDESRELYHLLERVHQKHYISPSRPECDVKDALSPEYAARIRYEAADIANFAMMIQDVTTNVLKPYEPHGWDALDDSVPREPHEMKPPVPPAGEASTEPLFPLGGGQDKG